MSTMQAMAGIESLTICCSSQFLIGRVRKLNQKR